MMQQQPQRIKEDIAVVLDYLANGYPLDKRPMHKKTPIVQAIGKEHFVLLELVPKREAGFQPGDDVYIGDGKRDKIHHIIGRLPLDKLTNSARNEMEYVINELIMKNEKRFVDFFNKKRVKLISEPQKLIFKRILGEIEGKEKHRLFTE